MRSRLYIITPPTLAPTAFAPVLSSALQAGDVACVQLRLKDVSDRELLDACEILMPIAHRHDVAWIVNDRPDIAKKSGADGVHLGQDDVSIVRARDILGEEAIIGATCHNSRHLAMLAAEQSADYVAFGAFYDTRTKTPKTTAEPQLLQIWSTATQVPCVAIGGITTENCTPLIEAGADFLAVSNGIWSHPQGPARAVRLFNELMDSLGAK
ncbi:thiamine phosphate synthase [Varunaivibrio sulfuroxidans]|nr:thiamine phosphate synthase [Varunaivibrio sulfuroxidans]WES31796.1 thiamine phosphate synthase [Varunaivibrio sulfuroxidans]